MPLIGLINKEICFSPNLWQLWQLWQSWQFPAPVIHSALWNGLRAKNFGKDFYSFMFSPERFAAAKEEVSRIMDLTQCRGGSLLDLCCGPGRHAVEFA